MGAQPQKASSGGAVIIAVLVLLFILLPVLYVASVGPVVWLEHRNLIEVKPGSVIFYIYLPLEWAVANCPPLQPAAEWYVSLFR
jgi:hypothetical protein